MTVSLSDRLIIYPFDGIASNYPFPFWVQKEEDLDVYIRDAGVGEYGDLTVLTPITDYTVTGVSLTSQIGGSITTTAVHDVDEGELIIVRKVAYSQDLDIRNQGGFHPDAVEFELDRLLMMIQQLSEELDRGIIAPPGSLGWKIDDIADDHFWKKAVGERKLVDGGSAQDIIDAEEHAAEAAASAAEVAAFVAGMKFMAYELRADVTGLPLGVPALVEIIWLSGTTAKGDSGQGFYEEQLSDPGSGVRFADAAGKWWVQYAVPGFVTPPAIAADRTALLAVDPAIYSSVILNVAAGGGLFRWASGDLSSVIIRGTITSTGVDAGTDIITKVAHGMKTGHVIYPTTTPGNGLILNTKYYVIKLTDDTFKLATTFANATSGTAINLTTATNFTMKWLLDPTEGVYVIPTGKAIDGSQGAYQRISSRTINPFMFGASGNAGSGNTDDSEYLFAADEYCYVRNAKLDLVPEDHYTDPNKILVLYTLEYYFPWGDVHPATTDDWARIIEIAPDEAILTLKDGTYTQSAQIVRKRKGIKITRENLNGVIFNTQLKFEGCARVFLTGLNMRLRDTPDIAIYADSSTLYLDDLSATCVAGTYPYAGGGFIYTQGACNIYIRSQTRATVFDFSNATGDSGTPDFLRMSNYIAINYMSHMWIAPSSTWFFQIVGANNTGVANGIITVTSSNAYFHNARIESTLKGDGDACVIAQRNSHLRFLQDDNPGTTLGIRTASYGVILTGGSRVNLTGSGTVGTDKMQVNNLTVGLRRDGGAVGDISYHTATTEFITTTTPTSVTAGWTPV